MIFQGSGYNRYFPYEVVDPGKWVVRRQRDSIEFTQELSYPKSDYGYVYPKVVRLEKEKPEMVIDQSLKNTGKRPIQSSVYNHNLSCSTGRRPDRTLPSACHSRFNQTASPTKNSPRSAATRLSSRSRLRGKINSRCRSRASATMPAKCTEHNGDSPMCQADASCREAESPAAERTLYTDGEPEAE